MVGFVGAIPRLGDLNLILQLLFIVRHAIGKDDTNMLVEIESALRGAADVEMNQVPKSRFPFG